MERALMCSTSIATPCFKFAYTKVRASWPRLLAAVVRAPCTDLPISRADLRLSTFVLPPLDAAAGPAWHCHEPQAAVFLTYPSLLQIGFPLSIELLGT
jgi:hypothetical protein